MDSLHVDTATRLISKLTDTLFPDGELAPVVSDPTIEEAEAIREELELCMYNRIPGTSSIVESDNRSHRNHRLRQVAFARRRRNDAKEGDCRCPGRVLQCICQYESAADSDRGRTAHTGAKGGFAQRARSEIERSRSFNKCIPIDTSSRCCTTI